MIRLITIILILGACKAYKPPYVGEKKPASDRPDWVIRKPTSEEYYIGIGSASIIDPDYLANAKLEALDDLATDISVNIESSSLLNQIENRAGYSEQYQSIIKTTTRQAIELYEQVSSWNNDRYYWVQYRLSKQEFYDLNARKRQAALSISKDHYENGIKAEKGGEIIQSLHFYAQSIEALANYLNETNEIQIESRSIDAAVEAYSKVVTHLSEIALIPDSLQYSFKQGESNKLITIMAKTKQGIPVSSLAVKINSRLKKLTDRKGKVQVNVSRKLMTDKLVVKADFDFLREYPITRSLVKAVAPARLTILIDAPPITVSIHSDERNLNMKMNQQVLQVMMEKLLAQKGYRIVEEKSDFKVEINSNTRQGSERSGLFTSYLDFTVAIWNQTAEQVYSDSFSNIKGIHSSYQSAGLSAYRNAENDLLDELEDAITKNFINKD